MKMTIKFISTIILTIAISYTSAFACGEQTNGTRCGGLIENQPTITVIKTDKDKDSQDYSLIDTLQDFLSKFFA